MREYAAFLRGVMPTNAKMPELKRCFEAAGFVDVITVLSSGNVVFKGPAEPSSSLERKSEAAMSKNLGRTFLTVIRPLDALRAIVDRDPYTGLRLPPGSKRIVTFLREKPKSKLALPIELHGARILRIVGNDVFSAYARTPRGPVFMALIEKTFGIELTTRTWDTVKRVAASY